MKGEGNIRKLKVALSDGGKVTYTLNTADVLTPLDGVKLDSWIGKPIQIESTGKIHCTVSGKSIRKTYGDGMSFLCAIVAEAWEEGRKPFYISSNSSLCGGPLYAGIGGRLAP